jgi:hypothetical protein
MLGKAVTSVLATLSLPLETSRVQYMLAELIRTLDLDHELPSFATHECEVLN